MDSLQFALRFYRGLIVGSEYFACSSPAFRAALGRFVCGSPAFRGIIIIISLSSSGRYGVGPSCLGVGLDIVS